MCYARLPIRPQVPKSPYADRKGLGPGRRWRSGAWQASTASAVILLLACFLFQVRVNAQVKGTRRVLLLTDLGTPASPGFTEIETAVFAGLQKSPYKIEFYSDSLEVTLFPDHASEPGFREEFLHKYSGHKPDVIVAAGYASLKFIAGLHDPFFADTPVISCGIIEDPRELRKLGPDFTGVRSEPKPEETLNVALHLLPQTKRVVVVGGMGEFDRQWEAIAKQVFRNYETKLDFTYLTDLAMPTLLEQLQHLPSNTIVFYTAISQDAAGERFVDSAQSVPLVLGAANAPVFVMDDVDFRAGAVGGDLVNWADNGRVAAAMALRILNGEKPQDIPIAISQDAYMFDWTAMQRWGLKESKLPPGSVVVNRPTSLWQQYKRYLLIGIFVILAQMLAIFALLWQRSKRRRTEVDLARTNDRLRLAMESGKSVGWEFEFASKQNRWFGDLRTMFGIPSNTFHGQVGDFFRFVHPEDRERVSKALDQARQDRALYSEEFRVIRSDGATRCVVSKGEFEYGPNGEARIIRGMAVDITERKQVEEALRKSEEKFSKAFRESPLGFTITSTNDHRFIEINETFERITGWSCAEMIGRSALDVGIWMDPNQRIEFIKRLLAEGSVRDLEVSFRARNGQVRAALTSAELIEINGEPCALSVVADITEAKKSEEARQVSESRFSQFFSTLPAYCYMTSATGEIVDVNPAACEALGYNKEALLGKPLSDVYAPESALKLVSLLEKWKTTNKLYNEEMLVLTKKGKQRTVLVNAGAVKDTKGKVIYIASIQEDITERKETLQKLRESEERFRLVANAAPVMIWMAGPDKLCTDFNQPWLKFTGRSIHAELGNGWAENVHREDLGLCLETYTNAFDQREPFEMEYRLRRHDGEYRWVLDLGVPRFQQDGSFAGYIGSCLDVTDRKLAEESVADMSRKLIEAQEQERTWIARELHDDINQRIALVLVNLERLQGDSQFAPATTQRMMEIREQLSSLASDVQALSHHLHSSKLEYLGLATAAASFCKELSEERTVEIEFNSEGVPKQLPREIALCLFRVLQESLQNAVKHSGAKHFEVRIKGTPNELELTVRDSGVGFDPDEAIRGRGLGLTSMKERLKLVQGRLSVESSLSQGATICATVPLSSGARAAGA